MKGLIKLVLFVAIVGLAFVLGTILGGDKFGIGKEVGLVDKNGEITEDSVNQFVDNTKDAIDEGKEKAREAIFTPTPTPHPYSVASEIKITVGKSSITFFEEPCADTAELEKKVIDAHKLNSTVKFVVDISLAPESSANAVKEVMEKQKVANKITVEYVE
jgi:hypothetical protein